MIPRSNRLLIELKNTMKYLLTLTTLSAALALTACGKSETDTAKPKANWTDLSAASKPKIEEKAKEAIAAKAPRGDQAKALSEYAELDSGKQLMFLNLALSGMPADYPAIASNISSNYNRESDNFKKNDMLKALKPGIDQEIEAAKSRRYVFMDLSDTPLETFDFNQSAFPMKLLSSGSYRYFNDIHGYRAEFDHIGPFSLLKVSDENQAREIEQLRTKYQLQARLYMFAMDVPVGSNNVRFEPMAIEIRDKQGRVLATAKP